MKLVLSSQFKKNFKKRIFPYPKLNKQLTKRVNKFLTDPKHPLLKNHSLKGAKKGLNAFSITGDIRIIYRKEVNTILFVDIGTHNQVY